MDLWITTVCPLYVLFLRCLLLLPSPGSFLSPHFFPLAAKLPLVLLPTFSTAQTICKQRLLFLCFPIKLFFKGRSVLSLSISSSVSSDWLLVIRQKIPALWMSLSMCWRGCSGWLAVRGRKLMVGVWGLSSPRNAGELRISQQSRDWGGKINPPKPVVLF